MPINKKINCFISCSTEDLSVAREISDYLQNEGIEAATWDNTFLPGMTIFENLQNVIAKSDFVIFIIPADNTLKGASRENLFFEMGIIVGMGKPLLTLVNANTQPHLPSDLSSIQYLKFEPA
jgi:predicted nucleotide-binding protein